MSPGEPIELRIDQTLMQDATGTLAMQLLEAMALEARVSQLGAASAWAFLQCLHAIAMPPWMPRSRISATVASRSAQSATISPVRIV